MLEEARVNGVDCFSSIEKIDIPLWQFSPAKHLLVWNTGKIGDQLWTTAVIRAIKKRMPRVKITVACDLQDGSIYDNNPDIHSVEFLPLPYASLQAYDGHIIYDGLVAYDTSKEQPNCYQALFQAIGLDASPLEAKPYLPLKKLDEQYAFSAITPPDKNMKVHITRGHFLLGLHASSDSRNVKPELWVEIVKMIERSFSHLGDGLTIYGLSNNEAGLRIQEEIIASGVKSYIPLHNKLRIRHIAALAKFSRLVVSVDSMLLHIAGAYDTPSIGLMTTVPPSRRTSTYQNCVGIFKQGACQYAPCYWKHDRFAHRLGEVIEIAPCYTHERRYCNQGLAISIHDVTNAADMIGANVGWDREELYDELPM